MSILMRTGMMKIKTRKDKNGNVWVGKVVGVFTENIKGNQAIRLKGV